MCRSHSDMRRAFRSVLGTRVPSPLVGEGQDGGCSSSSTADGPLTLSLSRKGRGNPLPQGK